MDIASFWDQIGKFYEQFGAIVSSGLILLSAALVHFIFFSIHRYVHKKLSNTHKLWDDAISAAVYTPVRIAIWVTALFLIVRSFHIEYEFVFYELVKTIYYLLVLGIIVVFLVAFARHVERNLTSHPKKKVDLMMVKALARIYYLFISSIFGLVALNVLGIPLSAVIAFGGIGGLAIGFASQDFLANLFGGLMIFIGRPFSIGEVISSPDKSIMGTVEDITWRQVKILTPEKRPIYVPNSLFSTIVIENISRMECRRVMFDLSLRYDDVKKAKTISEEIEAYMRSHPDVSPKYQQNARIFSFDEAWISIRVWCYANTKDYFKSIDLQQDILLKCAEIVEAHGAEIAFPTQTIDLVESNHRLS